VVGDVFTDSYVAAAFADKNVRTKPKSVSVTGISISPGQTPGTTRSARRGIDDR